MDKVSVLLTSYNKPDFVAEAIESVLDQTYQNTELIILDDNSSEQTIDVIQSYCHHHNVIYWNSHINEADRKTLCRYAWLINFGVRELSSGHYLTYLADDDVFYLDRLERMVDYLETHDAQVVYGNQDIADIELNIRGVRGGFGVLETGWNKIDHNSVMHTREVFDRAGGWEDNKGVWGGADSYFWNRIRDAGYKFYPLEGASTDIKRYHEHSVQWLIANGKFFEE